MEKYSVMTIYLIPINRYYNAVIVKKIHSTTDLKKKKFIRILAIVQFTSRHNF